MLHPCSSIAHPVLSCAAVGVQVGVLGDVMSNAENVVAKGRLGPGQMVCADLETGAARVALQQAQADLAAWSQSYV
jgi:hypothetical protein